MVRIALKLVHQIQRGDTVGVPSLYLSDHGSDEEPCVFSLAKNAGARARAVRSAFGVCARLGSESPTFRRNCSDLFFTLIIHIETTRRERPNGYSRRRYLQIHIRTNDGGGLVIVNEPTILQSLLKHIAPIGSVLLKSNEP